GLPLNPKSNPALFSIAPPVPNEKPSAPAASLLAKVLDVTVSEALPKLSMAPPWLPAKNVPLLPPPRALLSSNVEELTMALPWFKRAPPNTSDAAPAVAVLLPRELWLSVRPAPGWLSMAPPPIPPTARLSEKMASRIDRLPALSIA